MVICVDNYHEDISYKGIRTYLHYGRIGLFHLESGKKTLPFFHCVVITDKYVFVEVDGSWGIFDLYLSLIAPSIYKKITPVIKIDRDVFISDCLTNQSAVSITLDSNNSTPTHIAIQKRKVKTHNKYGSTNHVYAEEDKACIYEVTNNLESAKTDVFVTIFDEEIQLINIDDTEIICDSGFRGYDFFPLWHYKDNMFIVRNKNGSFVTSTYKDGRFSEKSLWGEYNHGFEEEGSPQIVIHRNEFVSVCYPRRYRITGFPNTKQFQDEEKAFQEKCGKWALFKYFHRDAENNNDWWDCYNYTGEKTCFEQLISFVFDEPMTQLHDDNEFICHGDGVDLLMRFGQKGDEKCELLKIDERYETRPCCQGQLNIIACYDTIEQREDGLFNISSKDGYGLCDKDMQVIVPAKYDYPIDEWGEQLMIVAKNGKYGVINQKAVEIVPCVYTSVKIGSDRIDIWNYSSIYNDYTGDWKNETFIGNQCNYQFDKDIFEEGVFIVGVNDDTKPTTSIFGGILNIRQIPNYYLKRNVMGSLCDVYLPNGKMLTHFSKIPAGGIEYSKEFGTIMTYERTAYSKDYVEFLEDVKMFFIETQKSTPRYAQIRMLNDNTFLAFDYSNVGVVLNEGEGDDNFRWVVPLEYFMISIPINNMIYAWKWCDDKKVIDVFDLSENYTLIISTEYSLESSGLNYVLNEGLTEEQRSRLIGLDNINDIEYFPYEKFYGGGASSDY